MEFVDLETLNTEIEKIKNMISELQEIDAGLASMAKADIEYAKSFAGGENSTLAETFGTDTREGIIMYSTSIEKRVANINNLIINLKNVSPPVSYSTRRIPIK